MGDVIRGPWPQFPAPTRAKQWPPPGWKRGGLAGMSSTEARRDEILSLKPKCADCEVPFRPGYEPPRDGLCRLCREERNKPPPDDPALF